MTTLKGKTYKERTLEVSSLWVRGVSVHNDVDDECCPDFSCCYPETFTKDELKREARHVRLMRDLGGLN